MCRMDPKIDSPAVLEELQCPKWSAAGCCGTVLTCGSSLDATGLHRSYRCVFLGSPYVVALALSIWGHLRRDVQTCKLMYIGMAPMPDAARWAAGISLTSRLCGNSEWLYSPVLSVYVRLNFLNLSRIAGRLGYTLEFERRLVLVVANLSMEPSLRSRGLFRRWLEAVEDKLMLLQTECSCIAFENVHNPLLYAALLRYGYVGDESLMFKSLR